MKGNNKSVTLTNKKNEFVCECSIVTSEDLGNKIIGCRDKNGETEVFEKTKDFINFMDEKEIKEDDYTEALDIVNDEFRPATLKDDSIGIPKIIQKSQKRKI